MEVTKTRRGTRAGKSVRNHEVKKKLKEKRKLELAAENYLNPHSAKNKDRSTNTLNKKVQELENLPENIQKNLGNKGIKNEIVQAGAVECQSQLPAKNQSAKSLLQRANYRGIRAGKAVKRHAQFKKMSEFLWSLVKNVPLD